MIFFLGQICSREGHVQKQGSDPYTMSAVSYWRSQPQIPVFTNHQTDWRWGEVVSLERSNASGLLAFGIIERDDLADLLEDGPWFLSDSVLCRNVGRMTYGQGEIQEVSLVRRTANMATRPVVWSPTEGAPPMPIFWRDAWARGIEQASARRYRYHRASDRLMIRDENELDLVDEILTAPDEARAEVRRLRAASAALATKPKPAPVPVPPGPRVRSDSFGGRVYRHTVGGSLHLT